MPTHVDYAALAARLQTAWQSGRICPLAGRAMRTRILRAERAWRAGLFTHEQAARAALEAEGAALMFSPIPMPTGDLAE